MGCAERNSKSVTGQAQDSLFNSSQVAAIANISPSLIRKYIQRYGDFIPRKKGIRNANLFSKMAVETLVTIRDLTRTGHKPKEIRNRLHVTGGSQVSHLHNCENQEQGALATCTDVVTDSHTVTSPEQVRSLLSHFHRKFEEVDARNLALEEQFKQETKALHQQLTATTWENESLRAKVAEMEANQGRILDWINNKSIWKSMPFQNMELFTTPAGRIRAFFRWLLHP